MFRFAQHDTVINKGVQLSESAKQPGRPQSQFV
jgi:hypothetical protein